jgi:hypothetical protein
MTLRGPDCGDQQEASCTPHCIAAVGRTTSAESLGEQAYLVARGVRPLAIGGHCVTAETCLLRLATVVETAAGSEPVISFICPHSDGTTSYGYAANTAMLDLYEWATSDEVPARCRHLVAGLLLGYSATALSEHDQAGTGRRFRPWREQETSSPPDGNASKAGTSRPCSERSPSRDSHSGRYRMFGTGGRYSAFRRLLLTGDKTTISRPDPSGKRRPLQRTATSRLDRGTYVRVEHTFP